MFFNYDMKVLFISLGCDKNTVDSEMMIGMLSEHGYEACDDVNEAEAAIVNSCCFIGDAKEESINNILEMARLRSSGQLKALIVTGCLGQRYTRDIHENIPEVDAILGINSFDEIVQCLDDILAGNSKDVLKPINDTPIYGKKRLLTTGGYYAYLKIAEGCNKNCTYCVIPSVRGKYRSIPMEVLVDEAKELVQRGVRELILVAQETTLYGLDLYKEKRLPKLLYELGQIEDLKWIRILYCYPEEITDELIECIANEPKVCKYLDIPIQHGSNNVLRAMKRATTREEITKVISKLRERVPGIALRTTFITGFPGETKADFKEMLDFIEEIRFDRLGVFTYSREEGTVAAKMPHQIPAYVKKTRRNKAMKLQQKIAFETAQSLKGTECDVMIEGKLVEEGIYVGRTYKDAPGVDGSVFVESERELMSGDFIRVKITGSQGYDLLGSEII